MTMGWGGMGMTGVSGAWEGHIQGRGSLLRRMIGRQAGALRARMMSAAKDDGWNFADRSVGAVEEE